MDHWTTQNSINCKILTDHSNAQECLCPRTSWVGDGATAMPASSLVFQQWGCLCGSTQECSSATPLFLVLPPCSICGKSWQCHWGNSISLWTCPQNSNLDDSPQFPLMKVPACSCTQLCYLLCTRIKKSPLPELCAHLEL